MYLVKWSSSPKNPVCHTPTYLKQLAIATQFNNHQYPKIIHNVNLLKFVSKRVELPKLLRTDPDRNESQGLRIYPPIKAG